ncbi:cell wall metabolism sensor histidine kinase WalK [Caulobacter sp. S45]|uniref:sensor histidine kinase n=1 Tax=Caulobacter sp. S45 TaxID=1641861 RepID=UPI0020B16FBA|nr:ATP-binding protein [Caulobacter sp. S45]
MLLTTVAGLAGLAAAGWSGHADLLVVGSAGVIVLGLGILLALGAESGAVRIPVHPSVPAVSGSREEAETYALALELAPNPVLLVSGGDADDVAARRVLFANAEARELLRIPRDGALLVTALRHPGVLEAIDESLFGRTPRTLSYESGPQERFWRVWTKPLPPTSTHDRLALVIMRDETDVRQNERMRADFLANASHELRTPLASLTGFIETLRGHARDDEVARDRFLAIMSRQAERMARLIDDLLSLSRIELNEHIRPSGRCDLGLVTTDVIDALAPQISAKQVRIEVQGPVGDKALVAGDRDQIVQVVQNLLDNAVKYAPPESVVRVEIASGLTLEAVSAARPEEGRLTAPDGGRMSLLTPVRAAAERFAMVRVDDRGCGLTREHLPRLTERFYRVEGQNSGERTGTGLGLAIVKHIINRHRGGFFVESAPERGAAFCVYLPMAPTVATAPTDGSAVSPRSESKGEGVAA